VILAIFMPVWVDAFSPSKLKTTWMTLIIMASPIGMLLGYGLAAVVVTVTAHWWWAFYINIVAMAPPILYLCFADVKVIDIKEHLKIKQVTRQPETFNDAVSEAMTNLSPLNTSSPSLSRF